MRVNRRVGVWVQRQEHRPDEAELLSKKEIPGIDRSQPPVHWLALRNARRMAELDRQPAKAAAADAYKAEIIRLLKLAPSARPTHAMVLGQLKQVKKLLKNVPLSWHQEALDETIARRG